MKNNKDKMKLVYLQSKVNVYPVPWVYVIGLGFSHYAVKPIYKGVEFGNAFFLCKKDFIVLCSDETANFKLLTKKVPEYLFKHPEHAEHIRKTFDKRSKKLIAINKELKNTEFSKLSNIKLLKTYQKLYKTYIYAYIYGEPIAFVSKNYGELLEKYFNNKKKESSRINKNDFLMLITPKEMNFLQKEDMEMLKIAIEAKSAINQKIKEPAIEKQINIQEKIRKHTEKFTWIPYDYYSIHYDESHFMNELKELLKKDESQLKQEYENLKNYTKHIIQQHKLLFKKYKLTSKEIKLFNVLQHSTYLMDYKKEIFTQSHWYVEGLFKEISKRLDIERRLMQFITPEELVEFLSGKKIMDKRFIERLESRFEYCIVITKTDGRAEMIEGEKAKTIVQSFLEQHNRQEEKSEIKGMVAYPGKVRGKVRVIIDAKLCHVLEKGEILVTVMTSPDFMVAAKKAAAIVTDEGGITCHAAIVSREMKIPCIIGTKIATKVLKDGDIVEVDTGKGIVRKIKK